MKIAMRLARNGSLFYLLGIWLLSVYAKPEFNADQMEQTRISLTKERSQNASEHAESEKNTSVEPEETVGMNSF